LATLEFTHNNQRHADWPKTSFKIIQGESPKALPLAYKNTKFPSIDDRVKQMMTDRDEALAAHKLAQARMAERRQNTFTPFTIGQKVWLDTRNMRTNYHKKMAPKREGPFKVKEVLGPVTYWLKLPTTWKIHNIFHAVLLKPYSGSKKCPNVCMIWKDQIGVICWHDPGPWNFWWKKYNILAFQQTLDYVIEIKTDLVMS
jgi:hypothetical protein